MNNNTKHQRTYQCSFISCAKGYNWLLLCHCHIMYIADLHPSHMNGTTKMMHTYDGGIGVHQLLRHERYKVLGLEIILEPGGVSPASTL